jgi:uncharacterized protein YjeT (DUF2065 family)
MARGVEIAAAVILLITGLSQMYLSSLWMTYYRRITEAGEQGVRLHGLLTLAIGTIVLRLHWVWSGAAIVLSLLGVFMLAEGLLCIVAPKLGVQSLQILDETTKARTLTFTGVLVIVVAGVLAVNLGLAT